MPPGEPTHRELLRAITRDDVLEALRALDAGVDHPFGPSTKFDLVHEGRRYPPKAVVGLAGRRVFGRSVGSSEFSGGNGRYGANTLLRGLGFAIAPKTGGLASRPLGLSASPPEALLQALDRVKQVGRHPYYMWAALLIALDLVDERARPGDVTFGEFEPRFEALLLEVDPDGSRNAAMPFFHLSQSAAVWDLYLDGSPFTPGEARVPPACVARFREALAPALADGQARLAATDAVRRRAPAELAAAHRYLWATRRSEDDGAAVWDACSELFAGLRERGPVPNRDEPAFQAAQRLRVALGELAADRAPGTPWSAHASVGKGRWATTPWFALLDDRWTTKPTRGEYVVGNVLTGPGVAPRLRLGIGVAWDEGKSGVSSWTRTVGEQLDAWSRRTLAGTGFVFGVDAGTLATDPKAEALAVQKVYPASTTDEPDRLTDDLTRLLCAYTTWVEHELDASRTNEGGVAARAVVERVGPRLRTEPDSPVPTLRHVVDGLDRAARRRGLAYDDDVIARTLLSLQTKPFCLLAGPTGTGKSRLPRLFQDCGAAVEVVPVEPSWTDGTPVVGYRDLEGRYQRGVLARRADEARSDPGRLHVLVLDELNLARVEHYLAQWLSVLESRAFHAGELRADPLVRDGDTLVDLPGNLVLVGTVNMDESTFAFSQRVLDRANVITLPSPESLLPEPPGAVALADEPEVPRLSPGAFLPLAMAWSDLLEVATADQRAGIEDVVRRVLQPTQDALKEEAARARLSYRLRDEISCYLLHGLASGLGMSLERLVDHQLRQRLLPKLCDGSALLTKRLVQRLQPLWEEVGAERAALELGQVFARQEAEGMPASLWSVLA